MYFLSAVQRQDDVFHFFVEKAYRFFIQKQSVGRRGEQEFFARFCTCFFGVVHRLFQNVEIHQGFAAEEVHFQNLALAAVFDKEIDSRLRRFQAHTFALGMVRAFVREAIATTHIAIVANVNTKRLYFVRFHRIGFYFVLEQKALLFQAFDVEQNFFDLFVGDIGNIDGLSFFFCF